MCWQSAKVIAFNLQRAIEARAHVLECDSCSQIDDLLRIEMPFELVEDFVGNVNRTERHLLCIAQGGALGRREQRVLGILRERGKLLFADPDSAATGSVDVYSKDAADHLRCAQTDHALECLRGDFRVLNRLLENRHRECDAGTIPPRLEGSEHFADPPLHHPGQRLQRPAHLIFFERLNTHWNKLRLRSARGGNTSFIGLTIESHTNYD